MKADYSKVQSCCYPASKVIISCELDQPILVIFPQLCANFWCFAQIFRHLYANYMHFYAFLR